MGSGKVRPTYSDATKRLRLIYETLGFEINGEIPGESLSLEFGKPVANEDLGALYAFIDESILLIRYMSYFYMSAIAVGNRNAVIYYRLAVSAVSTLASIRILCGLGYDVNARTQLRLLYETMMLWSRFLFDEEARQEFEKSITPDLSNIFWHKFVSRDKCERYIKKEVLSRDLLWLGNSNRQFFEDAKKKLSVSSHPSLLSVMFDASHDLENMNESLTKRSTANSSHFTLTAATIFAGLPFSFISKGSHKPSHLPLVSEGFFAPGLGDYKTLSPPNNNARCWNEYFAAIRSALTILPHVVGIFANDLQSTA